jgi:predicted CoA-binding protein
MPDTEPPSYSDEFLAQILRETRSIAVVGASANMNRPSAVVLKYLQSNGYRCFPVNPGLAGQTLSGEKVYASLRDIPEPIDLVDIFRAPEHVGPIVQDAIGVGAKAVWMQLGVRNDAAAAVIRAAGLDVVVDRCVKIEIERLRDGLIDPA